MTETTTDKQNFNRREIEQQIIAWIVDDSAQSTASRDALATLTPEDFSDEVWRRAFVQARKHAGAGTAFDELILEAETNGFVPASEVRSAINKNGSGLADRHLPPLVDALKKYAQQDKTQKAILFANEQINSGKDCNEVAASLQSQLAEISTGAKSRVRTATKARIEQIADFDAMAAGTFKEKERLSLGIPALDRILKGGVPTGALAVLAARPSVGKTALAIHVAANALRTGKKVFFASLEMGDHEILDRLSACLTGVPTPCSVKNWESLEASSLSKEKLRNGMNEMRSIESFGNYANRLRFIDNAPYETLFSEIRLSFARERFDVLILDYIQLVQGLPKECLRETVSKVSAGLKVLARDLGVPVLALAQFNRAPSKEARKPRMDDLKESGSIEQDADIVMLLSDDSAPNAQEVKHAPRLPRFLEVAKHRQGGVGELRLSFDAPLSRFTERN